MGFNLTIGQLGKDRRVPKIKFDNAPADGSPTDFTNKRWPSYSSWGDFMRVINKPEEWLIGEHPGYVRLTIEHLTYLKQAEKILDSNEFTAIHKDRMKWLIYWVEWALKNCNKPVIQNT